MSQFRKSREITCYKDAEKSNLIYVFSSLKSHLLWHTSSLLSFDSIWNLSNLCFPSQSRTSLLDLFYSCFASGNLQSRVNKIFTLEHLLSLYRFLILCSQSGTVYSPLPWLTHRNGGMGPHITTTSFSFANYWSAVSLKLLHEKFMSTYLGMTLYSHYYLFTPK